MEDDDDVVLELRKIRNIMTMCAVLLCALVILAIVAATGAFD